MMRKGGLIRQEKNMYEIILWLHKSHMTSQAAIPLRLVAIQALCLYGTFFMLEELEPENTQYRIVSYREACETMRRG